ncbi:FAD-dependent monooxygenase [Amycolatopsis cihanbeyliensis]|uniref:2-polyprenyl-6-methoxyphenol hydroxylase-like FAD-dependent oxidoreductase n=1 Tax=Amycolatopsis cihanbeyliensis TaxID=1128664 RepID=A0A542DBQ7_AMYCI|nr:FAD-dependent monooxygenase [Amycolatopsis cihanbeyliensis]TQJ00511.1 2-polyprenyl-6-methoxyphenol hydroxylase-like FAD-dependent oxidoreductase [Amycolatopsis cihanbeyliensis]
MRSTGFEYDVVVAGAGPVGTVLACELRRAGVSVLMLERRAGPDATSRGWAGSMGPLAFEVLDRLGLGEPVLAAEERTLAEYERMFAAWARAAGQDGASPSEPKEHFGGLERIDPARRTSPERRRVRLEQPVLQDLLWRHADELGVVLHREHEVVGVEQDEECVAVTVSTQGRTYRLRTQYLVGCDGTTSTVRGLAGFDFPGTDPSMTGRVAVVELAEDARLTPGVHFTPEGAYVYGLGLNRLTTAEFGSGPPAEDRPLTREEMQDSIRRVSGRPVTLANFTSGIRWTDPARQASEYRRGRVLLCGDAAHMYAPVGGQGLNVGLTDAANLGWKLAAQVHRWAPSGLLDSYRGERHPVAERLLQNTKAQIALIRSDPQSSALRELFDELFELDDVHRLIADMLAGMDVRYPLGSAHPLVGTLIGDAELSVATDDSGATGKTRLATLFDGRGVLVDLRAGSAVSAAAAPWAARVRRTAATAIGPVARTDADALLLRPDGCVAWALPPDAPFHAAQLRTALASWFGEPGTTEEARSADRQGVIHTS